MPTEIEKEHEVTFDEILSSMAESLVETHAVFRVRDIADPVRGFTTGLVERLSFLSLFFILCAYIYVSTHLESIHLICI